MIKQLQFKTKAFCLYVVCMYSVLSMNGQGLVNTSWDAADNLKKSLYNSGIDSIRIIFKPGNQMQFKYSFNTGDTVGNGIWWQIDADHVGFMDTSGVGIGIACNADDTCIFKYTISSDFLLLDVQITDGCATRGSIFAGSEWKKTGSLLGIQTKLTNSSSIHIYPNPTAGTLHINLQNKLTNESQIKISIYNFMGKEVLNTASDNGTIEIRNLQTLPIGQYLVYIQTQDGEVHARTFSLNY